MTHKKSKASAKSLLNNIDNEEAKAELEKTLDNRRTARRLSALRVLKNLSQAEVAEAMGCTQSKVSKLESSDDDKWSVEDMRSYANAVGYTAHLGILPKNMKPTEEVKALTFAIRNRMESLAKLANVDEDIASGVSNFFYELFLNFGKIFTTVADQLPAKPDGSRHLECTMTTENAEQDVIELMSGDTTTL